MAKVLIVEDHPLVQKGIATVLMERPGFEIDTACTGEEALEKVPLACPDIIILDISLPGIDGIETLAKLKQNRYSVPVIILSMYPEETYAMQAYKGGASGYLTKQSVTEELLCAVEKVLAGKKYVSAASAELFASALTDTPQKKSCFETLSKREYEVMCMIAAGTKLKEIGDKLGINENTVSTYRARLFKKIHVSNNAELIQFISKTMPKLTSLTSFRNMRTRPPF